MRYFVAVAEELSFRRAAERLRISQPGLSKQIKELEAEVGTQLLKRNTGGVMLTDAGDVFLDEARDILERTEMAVVAAHDAAEGRLGRLTVGNFGAMSASFLPTTLSAFRSLYPQVEVNLQEMGLPDQLSALKTGTIHVGFTIDEGDSIAPEFDWMEVLESRVTVGVGRDHPLAQKNRISLSDLIEEQIFCVGETERHDLHRKRVEAILRARKIRHRPIRRVNSFESLVALVAGDHGVAIMLPVLRNSENIVFRQIKEAGDDLTVRLRAVWRKDNESQLARNFVETLRDQRVK